MRERGFEHHLSSALLGLEEEMPAAHARMVRAIGARTVEIAAGAESVAVSFTSGAPCVRVQCTPETILALAAAECTVEEAILSDRLVLFGAAGDLIAFHDALQAFLHGAVRAPSFPRRLRMFREEFTGVLR